MTDKLWTLISDEPICKDIAGVKVWIKPLTNGQKMKLARNIQSLKEDESSIDALMYAIAKYIDKIEGYDGAIDNTLVRIANVKIQTEIITAVIGESILSEDESKNLSSSSAG